MTRTPLAAFFNSPMNEKKPNASRLFSFHQTGDSARENFRTSIFVVIRPKKIGGMPDEMTSLAIHRKGEKKGMKREMKITQGME